MIPIMGIINSNSLNPHDKSRGRAAVIPLSLCGKTETKALGKLYGHLPSRGQSQDGTQTLWAQETSP